MTEYAKPLPVVTAVNAPFWAAARNHELQLQRCAVCRTVIWPITVVCTSCWSRELEWAPMSGYGRLSSWAVYHRAFHPAFAADVPYHVAEVDLDEGPRLVSTIVGTEVSDFRHQMPVEVWFDDVTPEFTLVRFREKDNLMQLDVGKRYRSNSCSTEIVVIKAPKSDVDLTCGGYPLSPLDAEPGARNEPEAGWREGTLVGKRYNDADETLEVLVTKAGEGTLAIGAVPLEVAGARKLPTSD